MVRRRGFEILYSLAAIAVVTAGYIYVYRMQGSIPLASTLFGHSLGVVGIALMVVTETVYSLRKHSPKATWGSTAGWLQFHIFTGLVGPYLVLLHSGLQFKGLAGITTVFTGAVVASGVLGRYLYTAVGAGPAGGGSSRRALATWRLFHVPLTWVLFTLALVHSAVTLAYGVMQR